MQYRTDSKSGNRLSVLGYGCMRFTRRGGGIDQAKAERELALAIEKGVNYLDTAYIYPGSEAALGKFLEKGWREKVFLATKLPHYLIKSLADADRIFEEELRRLRTDHIDYYLMHMLTGLQSWERLRALGMEDWIRRRKEAGQIRRIGFSYHGSGPEFLKLLKAYAWEFCQIQFNYMDEHSQAGLRGLEAAAGMGLPVIIMEPLRGGRLAANLPKGARAAMAAANPQRSPADWALRWIWNHPEATVALSGMNDPAQIEENVRTAEQALPGSLSPEELAVYEAVRRELNRVTRVGCTGCGYCMPCPQGVDIPGCFRCYNVRFSDGWFNGLREYFMCTTLRAARSNASRCIRCGKCEGHCPQSIPIRRELEQVAKTMEGPLYGLAAKLAARLVKF